MASKRKRWRKESDVSKKSSNLALTSNQRLPETETYYIKLWLTKEI